MGHKRAAALDGDELIGCVDVNLQSAASLGEPCTLEELLARRPDAVVVSVTPDSLADVACRALEAGAHVLVEKPAGRSRADVDRIEGAARRAGRIAWIGFNHRFHPGIARALAETRSGRHGPLLYVRARYGHGGRPGYESEWRFDQRVSGGGELIDQGMHLLDLCHALAGPLPLHAALLRSSFWSGPVEDNAALLLGAPGRTGPWASLHASWTEWKNLFSLEVACQTAKLQVDGLTGSYGPQRLTIYRMRPELGPPDVEEVDYPAEDVSWRTEWQSFRAAALAGGPHNGTLEAVSWAWEIVHQAFASEAAG